MAALEDEDLAAGFGEVGGADQAVVPRADDDGVVRIGCGSSRLALPFGIEERCRDDGGGDLAALELDGVLEQELGSPWPRSRDGPRR
jgi:hypothetical protein